MRKKLNNKGFTLVELLAVIAILMIIMAIAIPNISSAINRTKDKQDKATKKIIKSASDLYVSSIKSQFDKDYCVKIQRLIDNDYLDEENDYSDKCVIYKISSGKVVADVDDDKIIKIYDCDTGCPNGYK